MKMKTEVLKGNNKRNNEHIQILIYNNDWRMNKGGLQRSAPPPVFPQEELAAGAGQEGGQQSADSVGVHLTLFQILPNSW